MDAPNYRIIIPNQEGLRIPTVGYMQPVCQLKATLTPLDVVWWSIVQHFELNLQHTLSLLHPSALKL